MSPRHVSVGDRVYVRYGRHQRAPGTVTYVMPDPRQAGNDLISVRLNVGGERTISVWVTYSDLYANASP